MSKDVRFIPIGLEYGCDSQTDNYLVLHIRQGDVKFNASLQFKKVLNMLPQIQHPVVVISDDSKYRAIVEKIIAGMGVKIFTREYSTDFYTNV